jgi:hypothetical protein
MGPSFAQRHRLVVPALHEGPRTDGWRMTGLILALVVAIFALLVSLGLSAITRENAEKEHRRSNARVLAEYKAICIHRPTHVVDHRKDHP